VGHESGGVRQGSDIFAVVFHGILLPGAATDFLNVSERSFEPTLSRQQRCAVGQLGGMHLRTSHDPQRFPDLKPHQRIRRMGQHSKIECKIVWAVRVLYLTRGNGY
jgi:hypothetical protein